MLSRGYRREMCIWNTSRKASHYLYHYGVICQFIYFNYLVSVAYPEGFRHRYTGLGTQIKEKISLIQILEDKISIASVSNIVRNLTLRYPWGGFLFYFLKKAIETELLSYFSTSFYFQFWAGPSVCVLYIVIDFHVH